MAEHGSASSPVSEYSTVSSPAAACCASRAKVPERSRSGTVKIAYVRMLTLFLVTLPRPACRCSPSRQRPARRLRVPRYPDPAHRDVPTTPPSPENTRSDPESPIGPAVTSA